MRLDKDPFGKTNRIEKSSLERPEKLYRGITINPADLSIDRLREILVPGNLNEEDPTKIGDGNELGVYMSTNPRVAEWAYGRGGAGMSYIDVPEYNSSRGLKKSIQLPSCGILYEIDTNGLNIRPPEITSHLQGVYNNDFEGDEWIADEVPPEFYKVLQLSLSVHSNDQDKILIKVNGMADEDLQIAIDKIKEKFAKKKTEVIKFKQFLESLDEKQRKNNFLVERLWKKNLENNE